MDRQRLNAIGDKIAGLFGMAFFALLGGLMLYSCIDDTTRWLKPDYSKPHEYIDVTGYGPGWASMEGNDHQYSGTGVTDYKDNFFPIGEGRCVSYMNSVPEDYVQLSMSAFNSYLEQEGDFNDVRVAHAELQCVAFLGTDQACVSRLTKLAEQTEDPREAAMITLASMFKCDQKQPIGEPRVISLSGRRLWP
jgi:hypothetical protein